MYTAKVGKNTKIYHPHLSNIGSCIIGDDCKVHSHVWIGDDVVIGNKVKIQAFSYIPPGVTIEDRAFIGPRVTFTNDAKLEVKGSLGWTKTLVKTGARIGAGAKILAGVTIGRDAIVGMGAVVIVDVPDGATVVGNPAREVKG